MHPTLRNILAVITGFFVGSIINMAIIEIAPLILPNPEGFDNSTMESLSSSIHLLKPQNLIPIFLAHSLGTLCGAYLASKIAATHHLIFSMIVSILFLAGGIFMMTILPSPKWFNFTDIIAAYLPMGWIGWKFAKKSS